VTASLSELAREFLRLGFTAFGGPAAHIAIFQRDFVERRGWVSRQRFLDLLGAANLLPGPTSTEMAMGIGYERGRWSGLVVAGAGFILPSAVMVLLLAMAYERFGSLPEVAAVLAGMAPVVIAIVAHAVLRLAPGALVDPVTALAGIAALALMVAGVEPLAILIGAALVVLVARRGPHLLREGRAGLGAMALGPAWSWPGMLTASTVGSLDLLPLGLLFLKLSVAVFGSGYVLVTYLQVELVDTGLLTQQQLIDAVAIGQVTPGPVFTAATFVGYLLAGVPGAVVATLAIFLPSFVLVGLVHPFLDRIRRSATASAAVDGLNAAAIGLVAATVVLLAGDAVADPFSLVVAAAALVMLVRTPIGPVPLLAAGAGIGLLRGALG
jgi:chromate transporter